MVSTFSRTTILAHESLFHDKIRLSCRINRLTMLALRCNERTKSVSGPCTEAIERAPGESVCDTPDVTMPPKLALEPLERKLCRSAVEKPPRVNVTDLDFFDPALCKSRSTHTWPQAQLAHTKEEFKPASSGKQNGRNTYRLRTTNATCTTVSEPYASVINKCHTQPRALTGRTGSHAASAARPTSRSPIH